MNLAHSADSVVFYQVKLKQACPATGANWNSEISRLAHLARANNEGADRTAPTRGCFALFFASNYIVFSRMYEGCPRKS